MGDTPVSINPVGAIGFVRRVKSYNYADGRLYFEVIIENIKSPGPPWEILRASVNNPLFRSLLSIAFANGIMVEVAAHSMEEEFPVIDLVTMPPESL
jgi:hypothetical protein